MSDNGVKAHAGAAGATGGAHGDTPEAAEPAEVTFATKLAKESGEHGVSFRGDYKPGEAYEPQPPPPAEQQHDMGLHPLAGEHERKAADAAGGRAGMVGLDQPNANADEE